MMMEQRQEKWVKDHQNQSVGLLLVPKTLHNTLLEAVSYSR